MGHSVLRQQQGRRGQIPKKVRRVRPRGSLSALWFAPWYTLLLQRRIPRILFPFKGALRRNRPNTSGRRTERGSDCRRGCHSAPCVCVVCPQSWSAVHSCIACECPCHPAFGIDGSLPLPTLSSNCKYQQKRTPLDANAC